MKLFNKNLKNRLDLYDIVNDLENPCTLSLFPFPEESALHCPVENRPEYVIYSGVNSWGEVCHIQIELHPVGGSFMHGRAVFTIKRKNQEILQSVEEEVLDLEKFRDPYGNITKYRIGSLLVDIRKPFKSVRLVFRGFLRDAQTNIRKFAQINLYACPITKVFDNLTDFDLDYRKSHSKNEIYCENSLEQWIQLKGRIDIEGSPEGEDLYFWGMFLKSFEKESLEVSHLMGWNHKGMGFHVAKVSNSRCDHVYGHVSMGMGQIYPIEESPKFAAEPWEKVESVEALKFDINLKKMKRTYDIEFGEKSIQLDTELWMLPLKLRGYEGSGLFWKHSSGTTLDYPVAPQKTLQNIQTVDSIVLSLSDSASELESLTGGKGSSLAVLRKFSQESAHKFQVPEAVIVTSEAYKLFLNSNPDLKKEVDSFGKRILDCRGNTEKIKEECLKIQDKVNSKSLPESLVNILKQKMFDVFDSSPSDASYAVRSSAVGEDSAEMSAAGQMTTFLGVKNFNDICQSIVKCWASQFSLTAVEYKRGYGQSIHSAMAVVVQQMVDCEVAGVMFTCDPLTGNPRYLSITGSFGLGESVVSALVDPDEYKVELDVQTEQFSVRQVADIRVGAKKSKISLAGEWTQHEEVGDSERKARCLTDEQVFELARIGLAVQQHYGNSRDIEWGIKDGHWFLLQSRPVTNLESLTEWEIMHELDSGHLSENELMSRANVGEVIPGASSYALYHYVFGAWAPVSFASFAKMSGEPLSAYNPYCSMGFATTYNISFFALKSKMGIMGRKTATDGNAFIDGFEYSLLGHKLTEPQLFEDIFEKLPDLKKNQQLMMLLYFPKTMILAHRDNKKMQKKWINYSIECDPGWSSTQMFNKILGEFTTISAVFLNHMAVSQLSMFYNATLYHFLATKTGITDEQQILDLFSRITSSVDDVFSAQVPQRLKQIAAKISEPSAFLSMTDDEAANYLRTNCSEFNEFIQEFGHRGYKEFDFFALQWEQNPVPIVHSLKSLLGTSDVQAKKVNNLDYNLNKYELGWIHKKILKKSLIPRVHQGIRDRELGKNLLIRSYHQFRKFFYKMGEKLVEEGKIPQKELIFFMSPSELRQIIEHPSDPLIIINAKKRLNLHPKKDSYKFDEHTWGHEMKPKNLLPKQPIPDGAVKLTGVPISSGQVVARCCVAETLEDAKNIQNGDILITYSTDIGWSPYFAALSGLVTEIGGLVSHGAVIAREYGLPCLVGVDDATSHFATGDTLLLDSAAGFVTKLVMSQDEREDATTTKTTTTTTTTTTATKTDNCVCDNQNSDDATN